MAVQLETSERMTHIARFRSKSSVGKPQESYSATKKYKPVLEIPI